MPARIRLTVDVAPELAAWLEKVARHRDLTEGMVLEELLLPVIIYSQSSVTTLDTLLRPAEHGA